MYCVRYTTIKLCKCHNTINIYHLKYTQFCRYFVLLHAQSPLDITERPKVDTISEQRVYNHSGIINLQKMFRMVTILPVFKVGSGNRVTARKVEARWAGKLVATTDRNAQCWTPIDLDG